MAKLTQRIERLLDKLYNLKGDNNFIIEDIANSIENARETKQNATDSQKAAEAKKSDVIGKLTVFENQRDAFTSAFEDLSDETFASLRDIGVNADFGTMLTQINEKSPEYCKELNAQIDGYTEEITTSQNEIERCTIEIDSLETSKKEEEEKRNKLISLLEQSLSSDDIERDALSTSYVKKVISAFGCFDSEEVTSITKLIMFPEDGLFEYDKNYETRLANGEIRFGTAEESEPEPEAIAENGIKGDTNAASEGEQELGEAEVPDEDVEEQGITFANEAEEMYRDSADSQDLTIPTAEEQQEEVVEDVHQLEEVDPSGLDLNALNGGQDQQEEQTILTSDVEEEQPAAIEESNEPTFEDYLESIGLKLGRFTNRQEAVELLASVEAKIVEENFEILRSAYVKEDVIYNIENGYSYLIDVDLNKKITLLRAKGISELKIKELIEKNNSSLRLDNNAFGEKIASVENIYGKLNDTTVSKLDIDLSCYEANQRALSEYGYEVDDKEVRNFSSVLYNSPFIPADVKILKDYLISLIKNNSKYALGVFWQNPEDLTTDIDDIIEADLENILSSNPEILGTKASELLRRVKYCQEKGHPVYEDEDRESYCDYIVDYMKFSEKIASSENLPELETRKNDRLANIIGNTDYVEILVDTLNNYYQNLDENSLEFTPEIKEQADALKQKMLDELGVTDFGKYTYKLSDVCVSKNKVERNLRILLDALANSNQSPEGVEKELILISILYNLRQSEETLKKMASEGLGFSGSNTLGGKVL